LSAFPPALPIDFRGKMSGEYPEKIPNELAHLLEGDWVGLVWFGLDLPATKYASSIFVDEAHFSRHWRVTFTLLALFTFSFFLALAFHNFALHTFCGWVTLLLLIKSAHTHTHTTSENFLLIFHSFFCLLPALISCLLLIWLNEA